MIEELQMINHWLQNKEPNFLAKHGIDSTYFFALSDTVTYIERFRDTNHGVLPTMDTVGVEFDDFRKLNELDPIEYLVKQLREQKAYTEYAPVLSASATLMAEGKTLESMFKLRGDVDSLIKKYASSVEQYDWVKNAVERYNEYMKNHGKEGLAGLPTGISKLDELTGGWMEDDLILLAGRLNEGKSLLGTFFAFKVWIAFKLAGIKRPVAFISTEMSALEVSYRLDTLKAHFSNRGLREGKIAQHELYREYLEELSKNENGLIILSQETNGGNPFKTTDVLTMVESERPGFLIIDQLYDIVDIRGDWDIRRRIVNATREIRDINLMTKTPTMILVQAGREAAKDARKNSDATPEIDQIQESDSPAQKATRALTIKKTNDTFKISLKKNRGGKKDEDVPTG
jgi:replicative DNA helicase